MLVGERKTIPACLISATIAFQLIKDGCDAYLTNIIDTLKISPGVTDVLVVKDFSDLFLD